MESKQVVDNRRLTIADAVTVPMSVREVNSVPADVFFMADTYGMTLFKRRAYICEGSEVRIVNDEGYMTITSAFIARPKGCQYCVLVNANEEVILVNMFDLWVSNNKAEVEFKPESTPSFPTVEAAIMYAVTTA